MILRMPNNLHTSDPQITRDVTQRMANCGVRPPSQVRVASAKGVVTLSGTIQYEHQRQQALKAVSGVAGVSRVVDQMKAMPPAHRK